MGDREKSPDGLGSHSARFHLPRRIPFLGIPENQRLISQNNRVNISIRYNFAREYLRSFTGKTFFRNTRRLTLFLAVAISILEEEELMSLKRVATKSLHYLRLAFTSLVMFQFTFAGPLANA